MPASPTYHRWLDCTCWSLPWLNAILTDVLPDTVAYISVISSQGTCAGGRTVNCSFGTIASGASVTITLQVNRVNTKVPVVNTATVSSRIFDNDPAIIWPR